MEYSFIFVRFQDGRWMERDKAIEEFDFDGLDFVEEEFEVRVDAKNRRDAEYKLMLAADILKR